MPNPVGWSATTSATLTGIHDVDALLHGTRWASGALSYSFPGALASWSTDPATGYGPADGVAEPWIEGYETLATSDRAATRTALAAWSAVANLVFTPLLESASTVGDLRFAYTGDALAEGAQAFAYLPDEAAYAGDVWFNAAGSSYTSEWSAGSYEYMTVLHEIGHALGLKHSFESQPDNTRTVAPEHEARSFTIMSYSAVAGVEGSYFSFEPTTPMLLDVRAMQALYGANITRASGATTWRYESGQQYHQTIWDSGGVDTLVLAGSDPGVINLYPGYLGSRVAAPVVAMGPDGEQIMRVNNLYIAWGTVIENATGGEGADRITGNSVANRLLGANGADTLVGGAGNDMLQGGSGDDALSGGAGGDTLYGGAARDTLTGNEGADRFLFAGPPGAVSRDLITDFQRSSDRIALDDDVFTAFTAGVAVTNAQWRSGPGLKNGQDADDRLVYDTGTGILYYDADGAGGALALPFVQLGATTHPVLSVADILIVA